jgi:hypothetical protein
MNIYYVYIYRSPITNVPFYVGYGKKNRCFDHLNEAKKYPTPKQKEHKLNTIRKILAEGLEPIIQIVDSFLSKETACELEEFLISELGRSDLGKGPLTNLTKGGDGNRDWTPELREKMSALNKEHISAKDPKTGLKIKVHKNDPRWVSGELVGQNFQEVNTNKNGNLDNYILAKSIITGEIVRIKSTSDEWLSGNYVGINFGKTCHENTKKAASLFWKNKPKSAEQKQKNSESVKKLKWYCNFQTNKVGRFQENKQPSGYIRVSGPHKREII